MCITAGCYIFFQCCHLKFYEPLNIKLPHLQYPSLKLTDLVPCGTSEHEASSHNPPAAQPFKPDHWKTTAKEKGFRKEKRLSLN